MRAAGALLCALVLVALYATAIEPYWIQVTRHEVKTRRVLTPLRIAHLSDLHTKGIGRRERAIARILAREKPDLVIVTGDSAAGGESGAAAAAETLRSFLPYAPLGVWHVPGNWDHWRAPGEHQVLEAAGITSLVNEGGIAREDVWVVGVDDALAGKPDFDAAFEHAPAEHLVLALFHSPIAFDGLAGRAPLAFAGHTHGGQVRLPFLPPPVVPPASGDYVAGWYRKAGASMYVSRGLGTSVIPVRLFCRPEIAIFTVQP